MVTDFQMTRHSLTKQREHSYVQESHTEERGHAINQEGGQTSPQMSAALYVSIYQTPCTASYVAGL